MTKLMQPRDNNVGQWRVPGAREVAVRIEGTYAKPRDWTGNAQANEDLVGMVTPAVENVLQLGEIR